MAYRRANEIRPGSLSIDLVWGIGLLNLDRRDDAEIALTRAESAAKGEANWLAASVAAGLRGEVALDRKEHTEAAKAFDRAVELIGKLPGHDRDPNACWWRATYRVRRAVALHYGRTLAKQPELVAAYEHAAIACDKVANDIKFARCAAELRILIYFYSSVKTNGVVDVRKAAARAAGVKKCLDCIDSCDLTFPEVEGIAHYTLGFTYYDLRQFGGAVDELEVALRLLEEHGGAATDRVTALLFLADSRRLLSVPDLAGARRDAENVKSLCKQFLDGAPDDETRDILKRRNQQADQIIQKCNQTLFRWYRALSSTTVTGPTSFWAAITRSNAHIVSVFTTVVLVTLSSCRVTAFHAPSTLNRWRPLAARTHTRRIDHRQHR